MDRQRRDLLKASLALGLAAAAPAFAAPRLERSSARTRSGHVLGLRNGDLHVFRGIRYGADTSTHRFQPPQRELPWRGAREALAFGASAPQGGGDGPGSEDCLFLNLTTPGLRDGRKRPILFYIHGGGFNNGSGSDPLYDGSQLCTHGDVVVVTVNHRLNAFGYLYLGEFDQRFAESGNVGQLDLIAALQWVREHAAEFGGDAGNVTVFGQSGGGAKIATLMAMPAARGLFHRSWTMSGQQVTAAGPRAAAQRANCTWMRSARAMSTRCCACLRRRCWRHCARVIRRVSKTRRCTSARCSPASPCRGIRSGRMRHRSPATSRW
jgi:para-nitrobenzyl esterase